MILIFILFSIQDQRKRREIYSEGIEIFKRSRFFLMFTYNVYSSCSKGENGEGWLIKISNKSCYKINRNSGSTKLKKKKKKWKESPPPWMLLGLLMIFKEINFFSSKKQIASNYDVIVNCTGLGSGELLDDKNVFPIRGQIMRVCYSFNFVRFCMNV